MPRASSDLWRGPSRAAARNQSSVWFESLWIDARYAVRALVRDKTFAATAVLTLAVGLALASVAFTLFNAYVLRPFAVADPGGLHEVHWLGKDRGVRMHSWRDYEDIRARRTCSPTCSLRAAYS